MKREGRLRKFLGIPGRQFTRYKGSDVEICVASLRKSRVKLAQSARRMVGDEPRKVEGSQITQGLIGDDQDFEFYYEMEYY